MILKNGNVAAPGCTLCHFRACNLISSSLACNHLIFACRFIRLDDVTDVKVTRKYNTKHLSFYASNFGSQAKHHFAICFARV